MEISEIPSQDPVEQAREDLFNQKSAWATHIKNDHKGVPATSCHKCMNHKQKIMFAEAIYHDLLKQKSPPSLEG